MSLYLRGDGEYYVLKEDSLSKFKKLDIANDYIFMSNNLIRIFRLIYPTTGFYLSVTTELYKK